MELFDLYENLPEGWTISAPNRNGEIFVTEGDVTLRILRDAPYIKVFDVEKRHARDQWAYIKETYGIEKLTTQIVTMARKIRYCRRLGIIPVNAPKLISHREVLKVTTTM